MSTLKSDNSDLTINADGSGKSIKLQANGSEKVVIKSDGNVGIGTTSPLSKLDVSGSFITVSQGAATTGRIGSSDNIAGGTANDLVIQATGSSVTRFFQSSAESIRLDTDGLKFNGDTAAANALDDYEEGTWTPSVGGFSAVSYSTRVGTYTKVGNMVYVFWDFTATSTTGTGNNQITGLPFTISTSMAGYSAIQHRSSSLFKSTVTYGQLAGYLERGTSYMLLQIDNANTTTFNANGAVAYNTTGRATGFAVYSA